MNTVMKLVFEKLPGDFSPHSLPEILQLAKKIQGDTALVYEQSNKPFFMETGRLIIRRFTSEDGEAVLELARDRMNSSMRDFDHPWPTAPEGCQSATAYFAGRDIYFAVCLKPALKLIGFIAYNSVDEKGVLDLGHVWHTAYQDNDLDTEAISLMTQYAFEKLGVKGVRTRNPLDCEAQIAPLKSVGMEITDTCKASFGKDSEGNPIEFTACGMLVTKEKWLACNPGSYAPKEKPEIINMMEQRLASDSKTLLKSTSGGEPPRLSNIRPLLDGMKGHNYALPDCIQFILERVDGNEQINFWDIAAITGDTVAQIYNRHPATGCEYCVSGYLAGPEHIAYVFDTLGYSHEYVARKQLNADTARYLQKIIESIHNGVPVLVKTNINDIPAWESDVGTYGLIVGCENGGQILKLLVSGTEPIDYIVNDDNRLDLIFIGEKQREVSLEEIYLKAIQRMPYWLTLPERNGMFFGAAAFRAWADDIENGRFAEEGLPLWENYGVYVCNLATSGGESTFIFRKLAEINPVYSDLASLGEKIQALLPTETPSGGKSLLWIQLENLRGGMNMEEVYTTMRDTAKRNQVAAALREYANRLDQALALLTAYLSKRGENNGSR